MKVLLKILSSVCFLAFITGCSTNSLDSSENSNHEQYNFAQQVEKRNQQLLASLVDELPKTTPILTKYYDRATIEKVVRYNFQLCNQYGLNQTIYIGLFSLFNLAYDTEIDKLDTEGKINEILQSQISEQEKLYLIKKRIAELDAAGVIRNKLEESCQCLYGRRLSVF
ncbi:hypothetical protein P7M46_08990 [Bisgaard Taxon 10/6]|uniref:hypothetical protein n=1 Tax=Exercitatus varius TaxID=67857 RepID=UPI00294B452B|nr:hypothetical protein [Exercitatus varius]MDG2918133.1 hypothetical protein [Exercitatus varius]MDG2940734.1 hypothetical protein [Exercitatus varius]MDG2961361.1 hypothetical protein [Exercitatus varius]